MLQNVHRPFNRYKEGVLQVLMLFNSKLLVHCKPKNNLKSPNKYKDDQVEWLVFVLCTMLKNAT